MNDQFFSEKKKHKENIELPVTFEIFQELFRPSVGASKSAAKTVIQATSPRVELCLVTGGTLTYTLRTKLSSKTRKKKQKKKIKVRRKKGIEEEKL